MNWKAMSGIEKLRWAVKLFDNNRESVNQRFTAEQLLKIAEAQSKSEWDIYPDQWSETQLRNAALYAEPPRFDEHGEPIE